MAPVQKEAPVRHERPINISRDVDWIRDRLREGLTVWGSGVQVCLEEETGDCVLRYVEEGEWSTEYLTLRDAPYQFLRRTDGRVDAAATRL